MGVQWECFDSTSALLCNYTWENVLGKQDCKTCEIGYDYKNIGVVVMTSLRPMPWCFDDSSLGVVLESWYRGHDIYKTLRTMLFFELILWTRKTTWEKKIGRLKDRHIWKWKWWREEIVNFPLSSGNSIHYRAFISRIPTRRQKRWAVCTLLPLGMLCVRFEMNGIRKDLQMIVITIIITLEKNFKHSTQHPTL